jgi:CubicO group peptidase (beta-lactamase class C family)
MVSSDTDVTEHRKREIETLVTDWMADDDVPGASVAIVDADGLVYAEGFGARDLASNAPATPETLYGIGSCTKSFTALGIMQLVEQGEIATDDPIDDHLPHLVDAPGTPITIHDLLTHSSGMPSDGYLTALLTRLTGMGNAEVPLSSDADFRRHVEGSADERVPDEERFFYYNTGYALLAKVIETVSGKSYPDYVADRILTPLDMDRSGFHSETFEAHDDRMTAYFDDDGSPTEGSLAFDERLYGAGGLLSSVTEVANYLEMMLGDGEYGDERLVSPETIAEMHRRYVTRRRFVDGTPHDYGYGWMIRDFLDDTLVGHGGMMGTTTAWIGMLEDREVGVVVGCNRAPDRHPSVVGNGVMAIVAGADPYETVEPLALREKLDAVTGEYESYRGIKSATVERDGGTLDVTLSGFRSDWEMTLFPERVSDDDYSFYTIRANGVRTPVTFEVDDDGTDMFVQRWRLHKET